MLIHKYLDDKEPMMNLCKKYKVDCGKIKYRVNLYLLWGEKPFTDEQENRGISYLQFYFLVLIVKDVNNEIKIAA